MNTHSRARTSGRFLVASALAATLSSPAIAQTVPATDAAAPAAEPAAQPAPVMLPPVVVTTRRVAEAPLDVPAYSQVITRDQIRESGATNLIDLLQSEANLDFTSISGSPTNTKVSMRGTGSGGNGRTLVLLDGIRTNRADMGDFNWLQFSLTDIESIEVIQGPQGAFYGDNAIGGVIKINTLAKPAKSGGAVQAIVGEDATFKLGAGYTELFNSRLWANVSGGYETSDGWREHSGYDSKSGSIGFGYDNEKNSVTRVRASFLDNTYDQPGYLTEAQFRADPTQAGTNASNGTADYRRVTASNELGVSKETKLLTDAGANFVDEFYHGGFGTDFDRDIAGYFLSPKLHVERGAFTFTPGVDLNYDRLDVNVDGFADTRARLDRRVLSPYVAAEWAINDRVSVSGAARHEWNNIRAREELSGNRADRTDTGDAYQLAVNYKPSAALRLFAKYDHVFRFPATDEISYYQGFLGGPFGSPVFFNADLKPETSDNFEVGADYHHRGWCGGASVYYLTTEDEIFYNAATNLNENLAKTRRVGAQFNAGYDAGVAAIRSRLDYVKAELVEAPAGTGLNEGDLRMTPEWRVTTTAVLRPVQRVEWSVTHRFIGSSVVDDSYGSANPGEVDSVNLFDTRLTFSPTEQWRLFVGANNVFDKDYVSYATIGYPPPLFSPTTVIYPGQGRFVYCGVSVKF